MDMDAGSAVWNRQIIFRHAKYHSEFSIVSWVSDLTKKKHPFIVTSDHNYTMENNS